MTTYARWRARRILHGEGYMLDASHDAVIYREQWRVDARKRWDTRNRLLEFEGSGRLYTQSVPTLQVKHRNSPESDVLLEWAWR